VSFRSLTDVNHSDSGVMIARATMFRPHRLLRAGVAVVLMLCVFDFSSSDASAQKKSTPTHPPKPHAPRAGRAHYSVVQARDPHWRTMMVAPDHASAHVMRARLQRRGYQVRLRYESGGRVLVSARMMHWHTVGAYTPQIAHHVVSMFHHRGMQARIRRV
jgi:hypothetical protein